MHQDLRYQHNEPDPSGLFQQFSTPFTILSLFAAARGRRLKNVEGMIQTYFEERKPQPLNKSKEMERRKRQMERKREKDRKEKERFVAAVNEFCEGLEKIRAERRSKIKEIDDYGKR